MARSIFDRVETDPDRDENGKTFKDIFGDKNAADGTTGVDVTLRHLASRQATRVRQRLEKKYRAFVVDGVMPPEVVDKMNVELLADGVIVTWSGVTAADGSDIPFTPETAKDLLTRLPHFRRILLNMSNDLDNYLKEQTLQIVGN